MSHYGVKRYWIGVAIKKGGKQDGTTDQYGLVRVLEGRGGPTLFSVWGEEREYLGCQDLEQRTSTFALYSEISFLNVRYTLSRKNDIGCKRGVFFFTKRCKYRIW